MTQSPDTDDDALAYRTSGASYSEQDEILRELRSLVGYRTDPGNPNSMGEKDENARRALRLAGELIAPLLRWAINHHAGHVLAGVGPSVPWRPHRVDDPRLAEQTRRRNLAANSHDNEIRGAAYEVGSNMIHDRQLAAAVLGLISSGMNFAPGRTLAAALQALDKGEVAPIVKPQKLGRQQAAASRDYAQLRALQHLAYRRGCGQKKEDALEQIASAFGVTADAILQWEKRLPGSLDPELVKEHVIHSGLAGNAFAAIENIELRSKLVGFYPPLNLDDENTRRRVQEITERYSDAALRLAGQHFKKLQRAMKKSRVRS